MHKHLLQSVSLGKLQKRIQMGIVAVYAAVREQSHQMKRTAVLLAVLNRLHQSRIFKEGSILNFLGNTGKLLIHDTACAHVEMSYLGISHLTLGKSDCHSAGISPHPRAFLHQLIHHRGLCLRDRISFDLIIQSIAVKNHQNNRSSAHISHLSLYIFYQVQLSVPALTARNKKHIRCSHTISCFGNPCNSKP